jgi:uncharacterized membrane protein YGL010W
MRTLVQQLTAYAGYHRDPRNVVTHFIGIPMILVAIEILAARPVVLHVTPALVMSVATALYYLRLDLRFGLAMAALLAVCVGLGNAVAAGSTASWLGWGVGLFVVGWMFQFVGHWYEGKKPAFVDDLMGLVIGPLFVLAEATFLLGLRLPVQHAIEAEVGPLRLRVRETVRT